MQRQLSVQTCGGDAEETMETKARVLLVGLEPEIVDYSKSPVPGLTAAKVRAAVEADGAKLESLTNPRSSNDFFAIVMAEVCPRIAKGHLSQFCPVL